MSYQVLARKWRPRSFPEMVGQTHVLRALINALDNDRLHHAFLFTGTRGVGKTTIARILAKSLNCEQGVGSQPCGQCSACTEIDEGRFVDLIEVDAASRTKVEDTRELLENVQYAPTRGRYKVYLIDEVHMLSNHSFNALLKTLEEPPPHVKFLLATTDPQKLPVTILSRCLQFNLKRLPLEQIREHLAHILQQEGIDAEAAALAELARAADGSMRDALSLLDQAIAYGGGALQLAEVRDMLGSIDRDRVITLARHLAGTDAAGVMNEVAVLAERSPDFASILDELNSLLQRIALAQAVPQAIDDSLGDRDAVMDLASLMGREDVQLYYQIGLMGRRDLPFAPEARAGFEMVLLRMLAFRPAAAQAAVAPAANTASPGGGGNTVKKPQAEPLAPAQAEAAAPTTDTAPDTTVPDTPAAAVVIDRSAEGWAETVAALPLSGMSRQLAEHCSLLAREGARFELALDAGFESLRNPKWEAALEQALGEHLGEPVKIVLSAAESAAVANPRQVREQRQMEAQAAAEQSINDDPHVQSILERFGGQVQPGSVKPVE